MITGAIFGALIFGGISLLFAVIEDSFWEGAIIFLGAAMAGAGAIGGFAALSEASNEPCPEGTVQADEKNFLYEGCVPVEVAKKQAGND